MIYYFIMKILWYNFKVLALGVRVLKKFCWLVQRMLSKESSKQGNRMGDKVSEDWRSNGSARNESTLISSFCDSVGVWKNSNDKNSDMSDSKSVFCLFKVFCSASIGLEFGSKHGDPLLDGLLEKHHKFLDYKFWHTASLFNKKLSVFYVTCS